MLPQPLNEFCLIIAQIARRVNAASDTPKNKQPELCPAYPTLVSPGNNVDYRSFKYFSTFRYSTPLEWRKPGPR